jgi:UDP-glucose 4-epimerase
MPRQVRPLRPEELSVTTALVTGGAGFIGSNLADALVADGRRVHVVDDLSSGHAFHVSDEVTLHEMDIRAGAELAALVASLRPATIFHLAAQTDVRKAIEHPGLDADVNIVGTITVLEAARAVGARVLFASTGGAAYGEYDGLPIPSPETAETRPLSHYGVSKMTGEGYLRLYYRLYGIETVALRLANVYGPRQEPHGEAGVVAIFCGLLLKGGSPKVFGDGHQTRDYVYVGDVVEAFMAAEAGPAGTTANVGVGREVSVLELLEELGYEGEPEFVAARLGELRRSALDPSFAEQLWGWRARTPLAEGLRMTLESIAATRRASHAHAPPTAAE